MSDKMDYKLADLIKEYQVDSEIDNYFKRFDYDEKKVREVFTTMIMNSAKAGQTKVKFLKVEELPIGLYTYLKNWLKSEGFTVTDEKTFTSDFLKDTPTAIVVSWANVKPKETAKSNTSVDSLIVGGSCAGISTLELEYPYQYRATLGTTTALDSMSSVKSAVTYSHDEISLASAAAESANCAVKGALL